MGGRTNWSDRAKSGENGLTNNQPSIEPIWSTPQFRIGKRLFSRYRSVDFPRDRGCKAWGDACSLHARPDDFIPLSLRFRGYWQGPSILVGLIRMAQAVKPFIPLVKSVVRRPMNGNSGEAMDWRDNKADICSVDAILRLQFGRNQRER